MSMMGRWNSVVVRCLVLVVTDEWIVVYEHRIYLTWLTN